MRKLIIALIAFVTALGAYAGCTNQYMISPDGRFTYCQVCCDEGNNCRTFCF